MKYDVTLKHYRDFKVFGENKLPARAYFIPYASETECAAASRLTRRYQSDKVKLLNGTWDFAYFKNGAKMPATLDTDTMAFDPIPVPSCWQNHGYEPPFYVNIRYQFPPNPPHIPTKEAAGVYGEDVNGAVYATGKKQYNSAGVYRTYIDLEEGEKSYIISFLGVAGCLALYCNGKYVGYSEGSHNTAEFQLDSFVGPGRNELVAVVRKWCTGSYLEDQDMFRYNGIFRDVLLYVNEPTFVYDFDFLTEKQPNGDYNAMLSVNVAKPADARLAATLSDDKHLIAYQTVSASEDSRMLFPDLKVEEWSAEVPRLYTLTITLYKDGKVQEVIKKLVGFRTVEVRGNVFYFNGKPIKLMGVNHHDTSPKTGYYMTPEEWERDVQVMKDYNINCVRTSHYPPDPLFLELADLYGLYVIDEADIEAHGTKNRNLISNDPKWQHHYWDRVFRMYMRDRNAPSVAMWSLGNEAGGYRCQDYCYNNLKELTSIPVHYERACATHRGAYDVAGWMYMDIPGLEKIGKGTWMGWPSVTRAFRTKPFLLTEYAHAMGVGPGNIKEYWDVIDRYDNLTGGCVWEFADHAVYHETGKYQYTYGGDHGEYVHDGNFCVDGLFFPDRKPHTGALTIKNIYRPLKAHFDGRLLIVENRNYFRNANYLDIHGEVCVEGVPVSEFDLDSNIAPRSSQKFHVLMMDDLTGDTYLNLTYSEKGRVVATEQILLKQQLTRLVVKEGGRATVRETGERVRVNFHNGFIVFSKETGSMINYAVGDAEFISDRPLRLRTGDAVTPVVYRAPLDNDMYLKRAWKEAGYDNLKTENVTIKPTIQGEDVLVEISYHLCGKGGALFRISDSYYINGMGIVTVKSILIPLKKGLPALPVVGKCFELKKEYDDIIYYGCGQESYCDFKEHATVGVYRMQAKDFAHPYIRPQESGNRTDVRYAALRNRKGEGFMILANVEPFQLHASDVTVADVEKAGHREDLQHSDEVIYVRIASHVAGVGSNSCGPVTLPPYRLPATTSYETNFRLVPFTAIQDDVIIWEGQV